MGWFSNLVNSVKKAVTTVVNVVTSVVNKVVDTVKNAVVNVYNTLTGTTTTNTAKAEVKPVLTREQRYDSLYDSEIATGRNSRVLNKYKVLIADDLKALKAEFNKDVYNCSVTDDEVSELLNSDSAVPSVYFSPEVDDKLSVRVTFPTVAVSYEDDGTVSDVKLSLNSSSPSKTYTIENVFNDDVDVTEEALQNLADFTKTALEGTTDEGEYAVKNVKGEDSEPVGRSNSLYYKRYQVLNNRMNRIQGNLWNSAMLLRNADVVKATERLSTQSVETYEPFVDVMPIQEMSAMTYIPTQKAQLSADIINGKFYSDTELESMRELINDRCVLTCTKCVIKDSCPFYSQEEVIKMYCTGIETIDFYVKDNELDLLAYEQDANGRYILPKITTDSDKGVDITRLTNVHIPYAEIKKTTDKDGVETEYEIKDLDEVRSQLEGEPKLQYSEYVKDDLGWLLGARYGTIQKNNLAELLNNNKEYAQYKDKIPPYKYMYDALFIGDTNTYVNYTPSRNIYKTEFDLKSNDMTYHYDVETKIKIPSSLKIFDDNNSDDDVYLVSDDTKDANGEIIAPVIYLGKVKNIQYVFDLKDDGVVGGVKDPKDTTLYAQDVAQWCVNYYKGNCYSQPLDELNGGVVDPYTNHDQYWMEKVYKQINTGTTTSWCSFDGRKRMNSGYSTPLIDVDDYDEVQAISGRPVVADYINFMRKVSIRIYNRETEQWTIPWINENLPFINSDKYFKGLTTLEQKCEKQRAVLPLMKTNLRIVVVKN